LLAVLDLPQLVRPTADANRAVVRKYLVVVFMVWFSVVDGGIISPS
jgi:hypothetical protein